MALIADIRKNEDPDLLVFISHGGFGLDQKFARRVDGIDVLLSGHTHVYVHLKGHRFHLLFWQIFDQDRTLHEK